MGILKSILIISPALLFSSCYETFTPDFKQKPVLCLNSLIKAGEPIDVKVTHTWIYSDTEKIKDHSVTDAQLTIYANGIIVGTDYLPREGDNIRIYAKSEKYGEAEAEVDIPYISKLQNVTCSIIPLYQDHFTEGNHRMNLSLDFNLEIKMEISDDVESENFYRISFKDFDINYPLIKGEDPGNESFDESYVLFLGGFLDYEAEPLFYENIEELENIYGGAEGSSFFTDKNFSGSCYNLNLHFSPCRYVVESEEWNPELLDCGKEITLHSVSKSYYDLNYYDFYIEYGVLGNLSYLGYVDPIWGYSNVSTGAGVVAAESSFQYKVNLKEALEKFLK